MIKGRKTTQEERTEIVAFCIEHGKDYGLTVETYDVSYQQVYSWVRKYEEKGVRGLTDRRGKAKPEEEMTESDRLRQENKILQAKIKDQEMEINSPTETNWFRQLKTTFSFTIPSATSSNSVA